MPSHDTVNIVLGLTDAKQWGYYWLIGRYGEKSENAAINYSLFPKMVLNQLNKVENKGVCIKRKVKKYSGSLQYLKKKYTPNATALPPTICLRIFFFLGLHPYVDYHCIIVKNNRCYTNPKTLFRFVEKKIDY